MKFTYQIPFLGSDRRSKLLEEDCSVLYIMRWYIQADQELGVGAHAKNQTSKQLGLEARRVQLFTLETEHAVLLLI